MTSPLAIPDSTSQSLLQRAKQNDSEAWRSIVRLYGPLVHNWCLAAKLQESDLSDVFQEVFASAAAKLASFRHDREGDTFRGWLRVITGNKIRDHFRRRKAHPPGVGGSDAMQRMAAVAASESTDVDLDESTTQIKEVDVLYARALSYLRKTFEPQTWQAFYRTAIDGLPAPTVAEELGMSPAAVRKAKSRVLHRLRTEYADLIE